MNVRNMLIAFFSALAGMSSVAFAQAGRIGNPFASLGLDFYGFFLPWVFSFAIVYGLLTKVNPFGDKGPKISAALAFVIAFFVTGVGGPTLAGFFTSIFGGASFVLAGILVILLFATLIGIDPKKYQNMIALAVVIVIGIVLFLSSSGSFLAVSFLGPDMAPLVFWVVIIAVAIYFVVHEGEKKKE